MEGFSQSAVFVVCWVAISQLVILILRKERNSKMYLTVFSLAVVSYAFYYIFYQYIYPVILYIPKFIMTGYSPKLEIGRSNIYPEVVKRGFYIVIDSITKILLNFKFFNLSKAKTNSASFVSDTFNYVLLLITVSFVLEVLLVLVFVIGAVLYKA
jgi:hypothetical protein